MSGRVSQSTLTRLRVFRHLKQHMERWGVCPAREQVGAALGITPQAASHHMLALARARAEGLPEEIPIGPAATGQAHSGRVRRLEPLIPPPVDEVLGD